MILSPSRKGASSPELFAQGRFFLLPDGAGPMPVLYIFKSFLVGSPLCSFIRFPSHISVPFLINFALNMMDRGVAATESNTLSRYPAVGDIIVIQPLPLAPIKLGQVKNQMARRFVLG